MTTDKNISDAVIKYPCLWLFKVIGRDEDKIRQAVIEVTGNENIDMSLSHISSGGKYLSLNFEIMVLNEEERNRVYVSLKKHPDIQIVL